MPDSLADIWTTTQNDLILQMPRAAFDACIKNAALASLNDSHAVIGAETTIAQELLNKRWNNVIQRALSQVVQRQIVTIDYIVSESAPPPAAPAVNPEPLHPADLPADWQPAPTPGQKLAQADPYASHFVTGSAGYFMVSHYQNTFWSAYLGGDAYMLWQRLADEKPATIKAEADRWTDAKRYTYRQLTEWLRLPHPCYISGCMRECHRSYNHVRDTGHELPECCGNHAHARVQLDNDGRTRCMFWRVGLLQILHDEWLVAAREVKSSSRKAVREHLLELQCWRALPPLTPAQAAQLPPALQDMHDTWIGAWGPKLYGLSLAEWRETTEKTVVPLMAGYAAHKTLNGPYRPNSEFLKLGPQRFVHDSSQNAQADDSFVHDSSQNSDDDGGFVIHESQNSDDDNCFVNHESQTDGQP